MNYQVNWLESGIYEIETLNELNEFRREVRTR